MAKKPGGDEEIKEEDLGDGEEKEITGEEKDGEEEEY